MVALNVKRETRRSVARSLQEHGLAVIEILCKICDRSLGLYSIGWDSEQLTMAPLRLPAGMKLHADPSTPGPWHRLENSGFEPNQPDTRLVTIPSYIPQEIAEHLRGGGGVLSRPKYRWRCGCGDNEISLRADTLLPWAERYRSGERRFRV